MFDTEVIRVERRLCIYRGEVKEIILTKGKIALVDDADFDYLSKFNWHASNPYPGIWYAARQIRASNGSQKPVQMHREIACAQIGMDVDHRNGNGLDNQRSNLRVCSRSENQINRRIQKNNTSGLRGVHWDTQKQKWIASIQFQGKKLRIGQYRTPDEASIARDREATRLFGEYAKLNKAA